MESSFSPRDPKTSLASLGSLSLSPSLHQGWLLKECGVLFGFTTWKPRWCVINNEGLYYFRSRQPEENAAGLIPLFDASHRSLGADFTFEVSTPLRSPLCPNPLCPPPQPSFSPSLP